MSIFVDNLRQEAMSCTVRGVKLENDLRNTAKVHASGATEAVVFYSARLLEAILKDAHWRFFGEEGYAKRDDPPLVDIENKLHDYNQLPQKTCYWSKGLRLLGNEVRHSLRRISVDEADCALIFLEFILNWYCCEFPLGPRHTTIYRGQGNPARTSGKNLIDFAWTLNSSKPDLSKLSAIFGDHEQEYIASFSRNLTFPILLIQMFIDHGDHVSAGRLIETLTPFIRKSKGVLGSRFMQLKALLLSREKKLEDALQIIEPDYNRLMKDHPRWVEDETAGILAGIYKRLWERDNSKAILVKSHETYGWGWRLNKNPYLGINAASTALWLDNTQDAVVIAKEVKGLLDRRRRMIQQKTNARYDLNYWDLVTLAEANLLTNDADTARELYSLAFSRHGSQTDNIEVTRKQLAGLAGKLALDSALAGFTGIPGGA